MANTCFPATVETQSENFADFGPQIAQIPENRALRALTEDGPDSVITRISVIDGRESAAGAQNFAVSARKKL